MLSIRPLATAPIAVSAVDPVRTAYLAATEEGQDEFYALATVYYILGRVKNPTTTSATKKYDTVGD